MADTTLGKISSHRVYGKHQNETFDLAHNYCCGKGHSHLITFGNFERGKRRNAVEVFCETCAQAKGTHQVVCWLNREWVEMYRSDD